MKVHPPEEKPLGIPRAKVEIIGLEEEDARDKESWERVVGVAHSSLGTLTGQDIDQNTKKSR